MPGSPADSQPGESYNNDLQRSEVINKRQSRVRNNVSDWHHLADWWLIGASSCYRHPTDAQIGWCIQPERDNDIGAHWICFSIPEQSIHHLDRSVGNGVQWLCAGIGWFSHWLDLSLNVLFVVDSCAYCAYCVLTGCIDIHLTVLQCVLTIAHFEMCCNVL